MLAASRAAGPRSGVAPGSTGGRCLGRWEDAVARSGSGGGPARTLEPRVEQAPPLRFDAGRIGSILLVDRRDVARVQPSRASSSGERPLLSSAGTR